MHAIDAYAAAVVADRVPAGKYHKLACVRHLRDRDHEGTRRFPYRLDLARADRFLRFGELLKHYKGEWAGQFIRWQPHQQFRLGSLFGWVHVDTGYRRFRHSYNELPRKQGKSLEDAVVAIYATFFDGEPGAEGVCAATKRDQAKIVFGDAKRLVQASGLRRRIRILNQNLSHAASHSKLEPLGADYDSMDGLNPHFISLDEIHKYKTRGQIDVLETATGARRQPIIFKITTAGEDPRSPCGQEHAYACEILERTLIDENYFAFIAHADVDDDWTSERAARKANPNYGVSVKPDDLRQKMLKAKGIPDAAAAYKQKHLNLWVQQSQPWLSLEGWQKGQTAGWGLADLAQQSCFVGVDLASSLDLCAMTAVFPPTAARETWRVLAWIWTPEETLPDREYRDRAPYRRWAEDGQLLTTPGTTVDHRVVRDVLVALRPQVEIERIGFDPWHAGPLMHQLVNEDGFDKEQVLEVRQTYQGMSSGCLQFEAAVLAGLVDAGGHPVVEWSVGNAVVKRDGKENLYPTKRRSRGRIDPVMAMAIAWNLAIRMPTEVPAEDPDLLTV